MRSVNVNIEMVRVDAAEVPASGRGRPDDRVRCVGGGRTLYSVPWKLIGRKVDVRSNATMIQVFHDGSLVKTNTALDQGKRTDKSGYPPEKIASQMRTPVWCRTQASEIGDACREVIDQLLEGNALYRLRAAQGVLGLRKKYGDTRLKTSCARAIAVGGPSYRTIKGILIAGTETDPEPAERPTVRRARDLKRNERNVRRFASGPDHGLGPT